MILNVRDVNSRLVVLTEEIEDLWRLFNPFIAQNAKY
jgi:hypothetical protein